MTDISGLATLARATLLSGGTIASAEHNAWSQNVIAQMNAIGTPTGLLSKLESNFAGASQPGDKPAGKLWWDSGNSILKAYLTAAGTPAPIPVGLAGSNPLLLPDVATRTLAVVGLDSTNSNTALTSTSSQALGAQLVLPANALNANGRAYRATFVVDSNGSTVDATMQFRFNGTVILQGTDFGGSVTSAIVTLQVVIVRVSTTQYVCIPIGSSLFNGSSFIYAGDAFTTTTGMITGILQTVTNWTSAINFDVNISEWTSGTVRSLIIGEQIG